MGETVEQVMTEVRREEFLPEDQRRRAGFDGPLPIGFGQTSSQPRTVADMLRLLDVRPGMRVLDVGSGSGWTTALLARLVGPTGEVLGLEVVPQLRERAQATLDRLGVVAGRVEQADEGVLGRPEAAPYDRILVSAEATRLPAALVDQLGDDAVMVVPVRGRMTRVVRRADDVEVSEHGAYRFVPLLGG